jgi:cytoskeletal protein CcmA (bactofilin family)
MWNRRREEDYTPRPAAQPPSSVELAREGIPMSTLPERASGFDTSRVATIGKSVIVKGQIYGREDLYIDGEVDGAVEMPEHRLTIGPNGKVQAGIKAREVVVLGTIHGNVETGDKIEIRKDAKLVGDIKTMRVVIEDGAYFKGSIDIIRPEAVKPAPAVRPQAVTAPPPSPVQATLAASAGERK